MIVKKNNQYAVECQIKISADCVRVSEYFDSEEDAQDWVEDECWINSGEGWICIKCNEQIIQNLGKMRTDRGY